MTAPRWSVKAANCVDWMRALPEAYVDAIVTDPPYGLEFMGKEWDKLGGDGGFSKSGLGGDTRWPSYGGSDFGGANPTCASCGGRARGANLCSCETPDWRVKGERVETGGRASSARLQQDWHHTWAAEALRVLKPGGYLLAFGGTRTYHRLACAIEDAGFEVRDCVAWMYGSGFPKSLDVSKAIDKAAGASRDVVGERTSAYGTDTATGERESRADGGAGLWVGSGPKVVPLRSQEAVTADAERWQGWGTALKPAFEPIVVARKPLGERTVAANVLRHGTGALNIDASRIATDDALGGGAQKETTRDQKNDSGAFERPRMDDPEMRAAHAERVRENVQKAEALGRWPANVILDPDAAAALDEQTGNVGGGKGRSTRGGGREGEWNPTDREASAGQTIRGGGETVGYADSGGASRFFYCAKASKRERNAGLDEFADVERTGQSAWAGACNVCDCRMMLNGKPTCGHDDFEWVTCKPTKNAHPTVKPIALMRYLVRLVTPPGGRVIDPFLGSGTTGVAAVLEGFGFGGCDLDPEYVEIARARIEHWRDNPPETA